MTLLPKKVSWSTFSRVLVWLVLREPSSSLSSPVVSPLNLFTFSRGNHESSTSHESSMQIPMTRWVSWRRRSLNDTSVRHRVLLCIRDDSLEDILWVFFLSQESSRDTFSHKKWTKCAQRNKRAERLLLSINQKEGLSFIRYPFSLVCLQFPSSFCLYFLWR